MLRKKKPISKLRLSPTLVAAIAMAITPVLPAAGAAEDEAIHSGNSVIINGKNVSDGGPSINAKGRIETEERRVPAYTGVKLEAPVEMTYAVADKPSLHVSASSNILPLVSTTVENGKLVLKLKASVILKQPIRVTATGSALDFVAISGSGSIHAAGMTGNALQIDVHGSGVAAFIGRVEKIDANVKGSGTVDVLALQAKDVNINISGSGRVRAYASRSVDVDLSGSADVRVEGNPVKRSVNRSGSGAVSFR